MNHSDIWEVLGIEPTDDAEEIRKAYLAALPNYHPEDDPDGFKNLREAYEKALKIIKQDEGDEPSEDPERLAIRGFLKNFPKRMDDSEWGALFDEVLAQGIDKQEAFSTKLLHELMEGYYLPRRIWLLFDKTFSWAARANRLKEEFPPDYIEYVLNGMRYERAVRDKFFDFENNAGEDFEAFVGAYHIFSETLRNEDIKKAVELEGQNQGKLFNHPDYQLLVARLRRMQEKPEEEKKILEALDAAWPGDPFICTSIGDTLLAENPEKALEIYLKVLEEWPEHYGAKIGAARARFGSGLLEEAKASAYDLLMQDPFDGGAMSVFSQANDALVAVFRERLDKDPKDAEARYKLASCYYNLGDYEGALDLIRDEEPDEKHMAKHYELYADLFMITNPDLGEDDKEILLEYIEAWEKAETDHQRLKFLPEKYQRLGMDDVALEKAEILLVEFPGDPEICRLKAQVFRVRGDDHSAFEAIAEGLKSNPIHAGLLSLEALLLEKEGNLGAAVNSAEAALASFPFNLEIWQLLGKIYQKAGQFNDVLSVIKRAEGFGLQSEELKILKAVSLYNTEDSDNEAQTLFEQVLENDPDEASCLEKLGMIYAKSGREKDAEELFYRLVEKHESPYAYLLRGWLYANFPQGGDDFSVANAREDFRKALKIDEYYAPAWYQLGRLDYEEGLITEAIANFVLTLENDPEFSGAHYYLAVSYNKDGNPEKALRVLDEGMAVEKERDEQGYSALLIKKANTLMDYHMFEAYIEIGEEVINIAEEAGNAASLRCDLASAYYETGEDEKAEALFLKALEEFDGLSDEERKPYIGAAYSQYALFLKFAKRDMNASVEYYRKAYEENMSFSAAVKYARTLIASGNTREAEKQIKAALSHWDGGFGRGRNTKAKTSCDNYYAGECFFLLGKYKKAKERLELAVLSAPGYSDCPKRCCFEALFTLALIALKEGEPVKAREYYRRVLEAAPDRDYREAAALFE